MGLLDALMVAAAPLTGGASLTPMLVGAGLGLAKNRLVDAPQEARDRQLAATTQRWSPWTGMQAGPIHKADMFGSVLQGAGAGAAVGKGMAAGAAGPVSTVPGASEAGKALGAMDAKTEMLKPPMLQSAGDVASQQMPSWGSSVAQAPSLSPMSSATSPWSNFKLPLAQQPGQQFATR